PLGFQILQLRQHLLAISRRRSVDVFSRITVCINRRLSPVCVRVRRSRTNACPLILPLQTRHKNHRCNGDRQNSENECAPNPNHPRPHTPSPSNFSTRRNVRTRRPVSNRIPLVLCSVAFSVSRSDNSRIVIRFDRCQRCAVVNAETEIGIGVSPVTSGTALHFK